MNFSSKFPDNLNEEQKIAVAQIIQPQCNMTNCPFLLYGPPGTGKTRVLVEAIKEIVRTTTKHVLVCAHSNGACDEIANRLAETLRPCELLRMYAKSFNKTHLSEKIKPFSNMVDDEFQFPSLNYIYGFRVVVCTIFTAGCLTRARVDSEFDAGHFSFVLLDEAACSPETVSIVPIAGIYIFNNHFIICQSNLKFY